MAPGLSAASDRGWLERRCALAARGTSLRTELATGKPGQGDLPLLILAGLCVLRFAWIAAG